MSYVAFRCPLCGEPFQVAAGHQGQAVSCPHCQQAVAIPASVPDGPPPADMQAEAEVLVPPLHEGHSRAMRRRSGPRQVRRLTPEERFAFRRRMNLVAFCMTACVLALAVIGLLLWRG